MDDGMASVGRDTAQTVLCAPFLLGVAPGAIVAGFDVHRRQITFDALDTVTGEVWRGQLESTPGAVEQWVDRFPGREVHVAVEACTGWLFVCRGLERAGRWRTWPSRWRPARCAAASAGPRPIARTRSGCASCCARGGCRRRGARPSMSAGGVRAPGCATRVWTSAFTAQTATHSWASSPAKAPRHRAGRCLRPPSPHAGPPALTTPTTTHLKNRGLSHTRASLTIARKLARRSYHLLRALGPTALDPTRHHSPQPLRPRYPSTMRLTRAASSSSDRGTHPQRGGPPKTERPQSLHRNYPSTISSPTATTGSRGPDKGGRPRSQTPGRYLTTPTSSDNRSRDGPAAHDRVATVSTVGCVTPPA